jgi:GDP-mannose 4,6 dehydratase
MRFPTRYMESADIDMTSAPASHVGQPIIAILCMKRYSLRKRTLVTGGAGFLGSHLCDRLLSDGCDVLCVDNFFTGTRWNIEHLLDNPSFELLRHDITFPLYVEVDEIYNLACPADLPVFFGPLITFGKGPLTGPGNSDHAECESAAPRRSPSPQILEASDP